MISIAIPIVLVVALIIGVVAVTSGRKSDGRDE